MLLLALPFLFISCKKDEDKKNEINEDPKPSEVEIVISTLDATSIEAKTAVFNASISTKDHSYEKAGFMYGTSENELNLLAVAEIKEDNFSAKVNNLEGNTTYYFKAFIVPVDAEDASNIMAKDIKSFTTKEPQIIETLPPNNLTLNKAILRGQINEPDIILNKIGFMWGKSKNLLDQTVTAQLNGTEFTAEISDLKPKTTYYFRAFAKTSDEPQETIYTYTPLSFTTLARPREVSLLKFYPFEYNGELIVPIHGTKAIVRLVSPNREDNAPIKEIGFTYKADEKGLEKKVICTESYIDVENSNTVYYAWIEDLEVKTMYGYKAYVIDEQDTKVFGDDEIYEFTKTIGPEWNSYEFIDVTANKNKWSMFLYYIGEKKAQKWGVRYGVSSDNLNYEAKSNFNIKITETYIGGYLECEFQSEVGETIFCQAYQIDEDGTEHADEVKKITLFK